MNRGPLLGLVAAGALLCAPAAGAATFTVDTTVDAPDVNTGDGVCAITTASCSLRAAVQQANALPGGDAIVLPAGTYVLGTTLSVTSRIDLAGAGARTTIIDGPNAALSVGFTGGGDMAWRDVAIVDGARGVDIVGSEVRLERTTVRGHGPTSVDGAGIRISTAGKLALVRSTVSGNEVVDVSEAVGGGIDVHDGGVASVLHSTVSGNSATATGGGSTVFGGGLAVRNGGSLAIRTSTILANAMSSGSAAQNGGNLYRSPTGTATIQDSVIAGAIGAGLADRNCGNNKPTALGRNIDDIDSCGFGAGHLKNTDPLLGPLTDNGGPTDTHGPQLSSPVRDAASACGADGFDQRGALAPAGLACDIGAVELGADLRTTVEASRTSVPAGGELTFVVRVGNAGGDAAAATALDLAYADGSTALNVIPSQGTCSTATRCELGTLAAGTTAVVTALVRAPATGGVALSGSATSGVPDPTPDDATAAVTVPVEGATIVPLPPGTTPPAPTPPGTAPPTADRTAPSLGALRVVGRIRRARPASIRTTLSEAATVSMRVERVLRGRRSAGRCRTGRRRGTRCSIFRLVGTVRAAAKAGTVTVRLPARFGRRTLAPGRHRLRVTATDAAGNASKVRRLTVTVAR